MKHTRTNSNGTKRHMLMLPVLLVAVVALIFVAVSPAGWARGGGHSDDDGDEQPFKDAEFFIEFNSTAGDTVGKRSHR